MSPLKGTISIGNKSSNHQFSENMLVFGGVVPSRVDLSMRNFFQTSRQFEDPTGTGQHWDSFSPPAKSEKFGFLNRSGSLVKPKSRGMPLL